MTRSFDGAALKRLMQERNIRAVQLSHATGIDAGTLRAFLAGRQENVSTRNLLALARFFGISMRELVDILS